MLSALKLMYKKNLRHRLDYILTCKFGNGSIHSKIKHNGVKCFIQNVQFAVSCIFCKTETAPAGLLPLYNNNCNMGWSGSIFKKKIVFKNKKCFFRKFK